MSDLEPLSLVGEDSKFREVIKTIDNGGLRFAIILNERAELAGILTDGDVRRALLSGKTLEDSVRASINRNPVCLPENSSSDATELADSLGVDCVLMGRVGEYPRGVFVREIRQTSLETPPVLLLAGGKGVRLRPLTLDVPKPLVEVGGKPIILRILESLANQGVTKAFVSVNYLRQQIIDLVGRQNHLGLEIRFVEEEEELGTAGPISLIPGVESLENLLVMNSDILTELDISSFFMSHNKNGSDFTVAVREHTTEVQFGVINQKEGRIQSIQEKPVISHLVSAGIYLLGSKSVNLVPQGPIDMPTVINNCISDGLRVDAYPIHSNWIDVGTHADLSAARSQYGGSL